jgi:hypothetical protein
MRARASVLTGAPIDEAPAVEHSCPGGIGVHGIPTPCAPDAIAGHRTAEASGPMASGKQCSRMMGWDMGGSVRDGSRAAVGALQPEFGVGFDPGAQCQHGDAPR